MRLFVGTIVVLALAGCSSRQQASDPKTDDPVATPQSDSKAVDIDDVNRAIARLQSTKDRFTSLGDEAEIGAMILGEMGPPAREALPALEHFVATDKHPGAVAVAKAAIARIKGEK
jgi:hypothetical protein